MKTVMGVNGEIPADELGMTLPHEHLFTNLSCYWNKSDLLQDRAAFSMQVSPAIRAVVQQRPWSYLDNVVLNDLNSAVDEANAFKAAGGKTIVDVSPYPGMGRNPDGLLSVSKSTGLNIIMACGRYSEPSMIGDEKTISVETLAARFLKEFHDGADGTGIKPGLLKVGFVSTIDKPAEIRSLRAAGRVQHIVGCALSIHPHIWKPDSHLILDILEEEHCDLRKVILCHQDFLGNELDYLDSLVHRGPYIEFDTFGSGLINDPMWQMDEHQKLANVASQVKRGNSRHILISGDMCMKIMLACGGGVGLKNIPLNVIPAMRRLGIDSETIEQIVTENPKTVFSY